MSKSQYSDTFARDNLPPDELCPDFIRDRADFVFPDYLNCADALFERPRKLNRLEAPAIIDDDNRLTFAEVIERSDRLALVLRDDLGVVPGNRVLLRGFNGAMMAVAWLAVLKAGGIVVATMPMLRSSELATVIDKSRVGFALCDSRLSVELIEAQAKCELLKSVLTFESQPGYQAEPLIERMMADKDVSRFEPFRSASDDIALIAFTSGTTGVPKGAMHSHRDVMSMCVAVGNNLVRATPDDIFIGSPPLAFTFGLGMLLAIPIYSAATTVLIEAPSPENLAKAIEHYKATICATAPTAYRAMLALEPKPSLATLRKTISAGEPLPASVYESWFEATGIPMTDGLGATEMLHIFIGASDGEIRPGLIGRALHGYDICILGRDNKKVAVGEIGRLAVRGPTGCRYLNDPRQTGYVVDGWNVTGDSGCIDEQGYFRFVARSDDMIISSGYNISPIEVESALLSHSSVVECAVVGKPDTARGHIVKAFVVRSSEYSESDAELAKCLKEHVKATIAPYKYPREIEFRSGLPRTATGKIRRFELRD